MRIESLTHLTGQATYFQPYRFGGVDGALRGAGTPLWYRAGRRAVRGRPTLAHGHSRRNNLMSTREIAERLGRRGRANM